MTHEEFEALMAKRPEGCMICGQKEGDYSLNIDHDHATGQVRGLLCFVCNMNLGWFEEHHENIWRFLNGESEV